MKFQCNICGATNEADPATLGREEPSCGGCHSSVRLRAIIGQLTISLFETLLTLDELPQRKDLRGVGLSDWDEYARRLADRVSYTNTYYHQEPLLDITNVPDAMASSYDFLISTDVFEHVLSPVSKAFEGARKLLRPGGVLILTVPYALEAPTIEHFPDLHDWSIDEDADGWVLRNRLPDGTRREYRDLVFHGGPGSTLELRVFGLQDVLDHLRAAGFSDVRIASEEIPEIGVAWQLPIGLPLVARA